MFGSFFGGDFDVSGGSYMPLDAQGLDDGWYDSWKQPTTLASPTLSFKPTINLGSGGSSSGPTARSTVVNIVNSAEPSFRDNRDRYLSGPADRTAQVTALNAFDNMWNQLVSQLSRYGVEGQAAIRDRSPSGGHSWFGYYRDPIERDPRLGPVSGTQPGVNITAGGYVQPTGQQIDPLNLGTVGGISVMTIVIIAIIAIVILKAIK